MSGIFAALFNATLTAPPSNLSLTISPPSVNGSGTSVTINTSAATAIPSGGTRPYSYAWIKIDSDGLASWTINSPSSASTSFKASNLQFGNTSEADFQCTVTDSLGHQASSDISASATHT